MRRLALPRLLRPAAGLLRPVPVASGLSLTLAVWIAAIPLLGVGPAWVKTSFARVVRAVKAPKPWEFTVLEDRLLIGTVPRTAVHLRELHSQGVRALVTLNQAWELQVSRSDCDKVGLQQLRLPTPDYAAPTQDDIHRAVRFMGEHIDAGHGVYVHCNGGKGRSAVCMLAYLMRSRGMTALEAYRYVATQRRITPLDSRPLGLPRPQWRALLKFEASEAARRQASGHGSATLKTDSGSWR